MPWTTLLLLGMTSVAWRIAQNHPDDVCRFLGHQSALICLLAGLIKAPLFLQVMGLVALLVYPTCTPKSERLITRNCPRWCLGRGQCRPLDQV